MLVLHMTYNYAPDYCIILAMIIIIHIKSIKLLIYSLE